MAFSLALLAGVISSTAARATSVYGNSVEFPNTSNHTPGYLLGSEINVSDTITAVAAGIIFKADGYNADVGIYTDNGGAPGQLVAQTGIFAVTSTGAVETPFTSNPILPAGNYWFMATYDQEGYVGIDFSPAPQVDYISFNFGDPLPTNYPSPNVYNGQQFNYYIVGNATTNAVPLPSAAKGALVLLGCCLLVCKKRIAKLA